MLGEGRGNQSPSLVVNVQIWNDRQWFVVDGAVGSGKGHHQVSGGQRHMKHSSVT